MIMDIFFIVVLCMYSIVVYSCAYKMFRSITQLYTYQKYYYNIPFINNLGNCGRAIIYNFFLFGVFFIYTPVEAIRNIHKK